MVQYIEFIHVFFVESLLHVARCDVRVVASSELVDKLLLMVM